MLVALSFLATCREWQAFFLTLCLLSSFQIPLSIYSHVKTWPELSLFQRWKEQSWQRTNVQMDIFSVPTPSELPSSHSSPRTDWCFCQCHTANTFLALAPTCEEGHLHLLPLTFTLGVEKISKWYKERSYSSVLLYSGASTT